MRSLVRAVWRGPELVPSLAEAHLTGSGAPFLATCASRFKCSTGRVRNARAAYAKKVAAIRAKNAARFEVHVQNQEKLLKAALERRATASARHQALLEKHRTLAKGVPDAEAVRRREAKQQALEARRAHYEKLLEEEQQCLDRLAEVKGLKYHIRATTLDESKASEA